MGYIYKLKNKKNGKIYIGQTIRPIHKRLEEHRTGKIGCCAIYNAIKKHGWKNFEKEWHEVPDDDLNFYEEMLVALLGTLSPSGYNLKEGGGSGGKYSEESKQKMSEVKKGEKNYWFGKKHRDETKQKQREAHLGEKNPWYGKTHTEETKRKMSEAQLEVQKSEEIKQKMSEARLGKTRSEETKQKMSEAQRGEKHHNSKKVYQYDLDGTFINSFGSTGEAGRHLKTSGDSISACARGKRKNAYGFKWSYTLNIFM